MKPHEVEYWVLNIIERVNRKQPIEDSRVEMKREWIDPVKAARRIAGHANAARGAQILWLIGVDEEEGVIGAEHNELSVWFQQVKQCFVDIFPSLFDLNVPVDGKTVVALLFDTVRAPFMVKNPAHGHKGGGPVEFEVPWREGTRIRSARRSDLMMILVPQTRLPEFEIRKGEIIYQKSFNSYKMQLTAYIIPRTDERIIIPFHKCHIYIELKNQKRIEFIDAILSSPKSYTSGSGLPTRDSTYPQTVYSTSYELIVDDPGSFIVNAYYRHPNKQRLNFDQATVYGALYPTNSDRPITFN